MNRGGTWKAAGRYIFRGWQFQSEEPKLALSGSEKSGFSLTEVIIAVAVMAVLGAVVVPAITGYLDRSRVQKSAVVLNDLANALVNFRTTVTDSPKRLSHLSTVIASADTTDCTGTSPTTFVAYGATNAPKWTTAGPYYPKAISKTGFPLPIGIANDIVVRTSANTTAGFLKITIPNVGLSDANELNKLVDGPNDANAANQTNATGAVQWSTVPSSNLLVTVTYSVPVANSC